jgi:hypothetical protein
MNVTRAVLPIIRKQRSGLVMSVTSLAGHLGQESVSAYAASKFAIEGWTESLDPELRPFGIRTMIVAPGSFRTELLEPTSTTFAALAIEDYMDRNGRLAPAWQAMNDRQEGDSAKLARALIQLADSEDPPLRWVAGDDAIAEVERKAKTLLAQISAHCELSTNLARHEPTDGCGLAFDCSAMREPLPEGRHCNSPGQRRVHCPASRCSSRTGVGGKISTRMATNEFTLGLAPGLRATRR